MSSTPLAIKAPSDLTCIKTSAETSAAFAAQGATACPAFVSPSDFVAHTLADSASFASRDTAKAKQGAVVVRASSTWQDLLEATGLLDAPTAVAALLACLDVKTLGLGLSWTCAACGTLAAKRCGVCFGAAYCCTDHQRDHYPLHRVLCDRAQVVSGAIVLARAVRAFGLDPNVNAFDAVCAAGDVWASTPGPFYGRSSLRRALVRLAEDDKVAGRLPEAISRRMQARVLQPSYSGIQWMDPEALLRQWYASAESHKKMCAVWSAEGGFEDLLEMARLFARLGAPGCASAILVAASDLPEATPERRAALVSELSTLAAEVQKSDRATTAKADARVGNLDERRLGAERVAQVARELNARQSSKMGCFVSVTPRGVRSAVRSSAFFAHCLSLFGAACPVGLDALKLDGQHQMGLVALRDIEEGELLFEELPFLVGTVDPACCAHCLAPLEDSSKIVACRGACLDGQYCSSDCERRAWAQYHRASCGGKGFDALQRARLRMIKQGKSSSAKLLLLLHRAARLVASLPPSRRVTLTFDYEWVQRVLGKISRNAFNGGRAGDQEEYMALCGSHVVIGVVSSMFNHDCEPNVAIDSDLCDTPKLRAMAKRGIRRGESLTVSYVDSSQSREFRQTFLSSIYNFRCSCKTCASESSASASCSSS